ncbi:hypothetical protein NXS19_000407 [Fusarium pseudograminearum]|nr:hypothetical protein NXS19_000407 [Fusarium pseudograminearum]
MLETSTYKSAKSMIKDVAVFALPLHDIPKSAPLTPCLRGTGEQHIDKLNVLGQSDKVWKLAASRHPSSSCLCRSPRTSSGLDIHSAIQRCKEGSSKVNHKVSRSECGDKHDAATFKTFAPSRIKI